MRKMTKGLFAAALLTALGTASGALAQSDPPPQRGAESLPSPEDDIRARADQGRLAPMTRDNVQEIAGTMADVLASAMDGDIDNIIDSLAKSDRDRIGDVEVASDLEHVASMFEASWEAKYGDELDWDEESLQRVVFDYDVGRIDERTARVDVQKPGGGPSSPLKLVDEGVVATTWRIDVPDTLRGEEIRDKLKSELQALERDKASWPADRIEAAKHVASRILSIVSNPNA